MEPLTVWVDLPSSTNGVKIITYTRAHKSIWSKQSRQAFTQTSSGINNVSSWQNKPWQPAEFPMNRLILEGKNFERHLLSNILHKKGGPKASRNLCTSPQLDTRAQLKLRTPPDLGCRPRSSQRFMSTLPANNWVHLQRSAWLPEAWARILSLSF